ncbi:hypothetical protein BDP81DRAFT_456117 [Colletotrichum phormii]|uniref:Secreted protein n=1 Tax=Colletotrichum phormii TaxID=359342 RepID=A0AAJ0E7H5_9PEZI|nr:uncharacterized protein BDP81DRAFT_456117 [Colletotrichum phormii]KAK1621601.1 hypothetical protein BDP81DRAFT_456117 [Colletotrichum phormii]
MNFLTGTFLLLVAHGVIANTCVQKGPPGLVLTDNGPTRLVNGMYVMDGFDITVTFAPASRDTSAGLLELANGGSTVRWVTIFAADNVRYSFQVDGATRCKTNVKMVKVQGAHFYKSMYMFNVTMPNYWETFLFSVSRWFNKFLNGINLDGIPDEGRRIIRSEEIVRRTHFRATVGKIGIQ